MCKFIVIFLFIYIQIIVAANVKDSKIVFVGSGLSSLTAAAHLIRNGYHNILLLEAEDRFGGRIHSVNFCGGKIDLGAQWVHGQSDNVIYEMLNGTYDFGLTGFDDVSIAFLQSDGATVDQRKSEKFAKIAQDILYASYGEMSKYRGSIGDFFKNKFEKIIRKENDFMLANEMMDYYEKEMNIWNGSVSWYDLSAQLNTISRGNAGKQDLTWNRDGYDTFFKLLTKGLPIDVFKRILYKKEVVNVQWNPNYDSKRVIATCSDGHKYFADHLIFTPSLGVLKDRYKLLFSPQLPASMQTAINAMDYGTIGKVFLEFKMPFWPRSDWLGWGLLWTENDKKKIMGTRREWLLNIQAFTKVDKFSNVIEALLAGPNMIYFENLSDEMLIADCMWLLEKFLRKPLPKPIAMQRTKWLNNRNFMGAYSYYSTITAANKVTTRDLAKSLYNSGRKPEVIFAGEHTDIYYSSNAHGAVNSGFRAANEIINYNEKINDNLVKALKRDKGMRIPKKFSFSFPKTIFGNFFSFPKVIPGNPLYQISTVY